MTPESLPVRSSLADRLRETIEALEAEAHDHVKSWVPEGHANERVIGCWACDDLFGQADLLRECFDALNALKEQAVLIDRPGPSQEEKIRSQIEALPRDLAKAMAQSAPQQPNREGARSRSPRLHELKTWPDFFQRVVMGEKRFELRKNDRDFHVGDTLHLREYIKARDHYTGREVFADVLYLLAGDWPGLMDGYVVMSIALKQA